MIDKSHMTIDFLEKNTQLKPTMVFDPDNIVDPNLAELSVEPSEIKLVENGEGTTALSLSFKFNGYDDILSTEVPVTVDLPEENKVLDFTLELSESDLNNFESLGLAFEAYQPSPACVKILEPITDIKLPEYSHNYKSKSDIDDLINSKITMYLDKPISASSQLYTYSIYYTDNQNVLSDDIIFVNYDKYLTKINFTAAYNNIMMLASNKFENYVKLSEITLPENLSEISENAFYNCSSLTTITIPKNVSSINQTAFNNCSALSNINVDSNSTSFKSEDGVLYSNDNSTLIRWPENNLDDIGDRLNKIKKIDDYAFNGVKILSTLDNIELPNNIIAIGSYAFANTSIKKITLPNSLSADEVGTAIFDSLTNAQNNLDDLIIDVKCSPKLISKKLIGNNTSVDLIIDKSIDKRTFSNTSFINNLSVGLNYTAPDLSSYLYIGEYCFEKSILNEIFIGKYVLIDENAFSNCIINKININQNNNNFILSNNVLYGQAETYNNKLSTFEFSPNRIILGLPTLTNIEINIENITFIDENAFSNCNALTSVICINNISADITDLPNYPWGIKDETIIEQVTT